MRLCEDEGCPHYGTPHVCLEANDKVTVCDNCFRASCWQGEFYCDNYRNAGTVEKMVGELRKLDLEHPSYWRFRT